MSTGRVVHILKKLTQPYGLYAIKVRAVLKIWNKTFPSIFTEIVERRTSERGKITIHLHYCANFFGGGGVCDSSCDSSACLKDKRGSSCEGHLAKKRASKNDTIWQTKILEGTEYLYQVYFCSG